ncbi:hypothetical protein Q4575_00525 [Psychrosphaera sp. 1_MG-2023]|uniref:Uncharacterized protein n=1 Tax=Psychrosphaera algicola TaxID=3023714 RepID=A0ABT5F8C0_9GAMM|nr:MULTISPECIES: hypothetical protein [unclassified Psychrosphaera]MDC2887770.1 hypothetical protein [Psychrosphaera sp. G1-22]MDO6717862.1 hypothetical protein [Psychrosphaera sp. 1_MG-2023]
MKIVISLMLLVCVNVFACEENDLSDNDKFINAVKTADFVYIGSVSRLYKSPITKTNLDGYNAIVFEVTEKIAGKTSNYMDVEIAPLCGISPAQDIDYWPQELGGEYVVSGIFIDDVYYVNAIMEIDKAMDILYEVTRIARANIKN